MSITGSDNQNHSKFLNHLENSKDSVWLIGRWLQEKRGLTVTIPPVHKSPDRSQWKQYADSGDLFINSRVEIKKLSRTFSCRNDWPFGNKFIVCAKHSFDLSKPKPLFYAILSADSLHLAIVTVLTSKKHWTVEQRIDSRYSGVSQQFYMCPLDHVYFTSIADT